MSTATEELLRELGPRVLAGLVRRGTDFSDAEDAVQEALVEAATRWPRQGVPANPAAWLRTVALRKLVDVARSDAARRRRETTVASARPAGPAQQLDDTLEVLFLCCHPALSPSAAVPLTLRAVGGLTTREIAAAYLIPEATVAQRISRAKRTLTEHRLDCRGDIAEVMRVLYLIFNEGYTTGADRVDLANEAIRLTRALHRSENDPEVAGLLALMLLHHARRKARTNDVGTLVDLSEQDRSLWDAALITEGVAILTTALAQQRHGQYQVQAAIAALHDDAATADETDWPQILDWYNELIKLTGNPMAALSRAVAIGEVAGPIEALRSLDRLDDQLKGHHRLDAVRAHLLERAGKGGPAAELFRTAADRAPSAAERDHLLRRAARARTGQGQGEGRGLRGNQRG